MEQDETVESVPWSELLDDVDPGQDIRRIAYLAAGLLGAVVLGAIIAIRFHRVGRVVRLRPPRLQHSPCTARPT
jgi:Mn2+/Fe2+ NRAMP family transporter